MITHQHASLSHAHGLFNAGYKTKDVCEHYLPTVWPLILRHSAVSWMLVIMENVELTGVYTFWEVCS